MRKQVGSAAEASHNLSKRQNLTKQTFLGKARGKVNNGRSVEVEELLMPPLEKAGPELRATKALAIDTEDYSTPPMAVAEEVQRIKTRRKEDATDTAFDGAVTICCCSILFRRARR